MTGLTPYEQKVLHELRAWQARAPGWGARLMAKPGGKLAKLVEIVVPPDALRAALASADRLARRLSDRRTVLQRAGVADLAELRDGALERCDRVSHALQRRAWLLGGASGALFGVAGGAGLVADVPTLLTLALRTIHRIGLCYGEDPAQDLEQHLGIGIFALVSANSMDEKRAALAALRAEGDQAHSAWRDGVERITERELAKEAAVYSLQNVARNIGLALGRRKAAGVVPVIGAAVGAAVNAGYISDVGVAARHVFRERWLRARHPELPALPAPPAP